MAAPTRTDETVRTLHHRAGGRAVAGTSGRFGDVTDPATGEVARGQEVVEFACGMPHLLQGSATANASTGVDVVSVTTRWLDLGFPRNV